MIVQLFVTRAVLLILFPLPRDECPRMTARSMHTGASQAVFRDVKGKGLCLPTAAVAAPAHVVTQPRRPRAEPRTGPSPPLSPASCFVLSKLCAFIIRSDRLIYASIPWVKKGLAWEEG